jgi:hypothetical protein
VVPLKNGEFKMPEGEGYGKGKRMMSKRKNDMSMRNPSKKRGLFENGKMQKGGGSSGRKSSTRTIRGSR